MARSPSAGAYRSPWAIKKTNRSQKGRPSLTEFDRRITYEADILKTINHPNIVGFRALTETHDGRKCLAMEECNISLADLIEARFDENLGPFPVDTILKVALDIGSALDYLHTTRLLLHGDLKSANILIKDDFKTAKLCDFGVCLPLRADGSAADDGYVGTACWTAPELLEGADGPTTSAADIFSYGLVLWEMLSLQPPHISALGEDPDATFDEEAYQKRIGTRPPLPPVGEEYKLVIDIFNSCTEMDFTKRPSALDIVKLLKSTHIKQTQKLRTVDDINEDDGMNNVSDDDEEADEPEEVTPIPTYHEAVNSFEVIRRYVESFHDVSPDIMSDLVQIDNFLFQTYPKKKNVKQAKLDNYLKKK